MGSGDQLWLNRHLLEAAFRQATGRTCLRRLNSGLDGVLVSDVGKPIEVQGTRRAGGLIARTVATHHTARRQFDLFFTGVARAVRGATGNVTAERGELWQWLERNAAIKPQELDQIKTWYADAHAERKVPLVPLQNLLDDLGRRIHT